MKRTASVIELDPSDEAMADVGQSRIDPQWFVLALLIPAAILVLWFGNMQVRRWRRFSSLEPRSRRAAREAHDDPKWDAQLRTLEQAPPSSIAAAKRGPVRVEGTIVNARGEFGATGGRQCIYRNRVGGRPESAIAADVAVLADASGRCGLENLEDARVEAPSDRHSAYRESVSLYVGDTVEVIGEFVSERFTEDPDPTRHVYGTLGARGGMRIRLLKRGVVADDIHRSGTDTQGTGHADDADDANDADAQTHTRLDTRADLPADASSSTTP